MQRPIIFDLFLTLGFILHYIWVIFCHFFWIIIIKRGGCLKHLSTLHCKKREYVIFKRKRETRLLFISELFNEFIACKENHGKSLCGLCLCPSVTFRRAFRVSCYNPLQMAGLMKMTFKGVAIGHEFEPYSKCIQSALRCGYLFGGQYFVLSIMHAVC